VKDQTISQLILLPTILTLGVLAQPANAQIVFYDNAATFEAASTSSVAATFYGFTPVNVDIPIPPNPPISLGGVTFTPGNVGPGENPNLFVATPTATAGVMFSVPRANNVLTCSGNENIDMAFSTGPTAVGFDTYLNPFTPPTVSVYDVHGNLLATHVLTQPPSTKGFLGIISAVPIGKVNWSADDRIDTGHGVSDPILDGIVLPGATFKLTAPRTAGLNLAITYRLEITNADGSGAQRLGEVTQVLSVGLGSQTITIPVNTPAVFNNQRLKLTISSIAGINVNLQMDSSSIEATSFVGTP